MTTNQLFATRNFVASIHFYSLC